MKNAPAAAFTPLAGGAGEMCRDACSPTCCDLVLVCKIEGINAMELWNLNNPAAQAKGTGGAVWS